MNNYCIVYIWFKLQYCVRILHSVRTVACETASESEQNGTVRYVKRYTKNEWSRTQSFHIQAQFFHVENLTFKFGETRKNLKMLLVQIEKKFNYSF